jgi:anaerobic magnesium-protoporphyrin IX monomethyl ester cyclase
MRIVLVNPPYQTLTSNLGVGHQVPLGLLMVGGALLDAGHQVRLIDAEARRLRPARVAREVAEFRADAVMTGHAGSSPAHPVCMRTLDAIKRAVPGAVSVYGGVYPSYHADEILRSCPQVDAIVRGEGEATAPALAEALGRRDLAGVRGVSFRQHGRVVHNEPRQPIADMDRCRAAWELIDGWDRYQCFGLGRAAIVQFSRGCPHRCTYCGQHDFWVKWRHRDPARVAEEIAALRHTHGVRFVTLADENPTTSPKLWRALLEEIASRDLGVHFFATIRAGDIVRDAEILPLYRRAGILYILLGIDATDPATLAQVNKRSTTSVDARACGLLRDHGIRSIAGHIVGLGNETWADFRRARRALHAYDADLLNVMYATPHAWTPFARESAERPVVQEDRRRWDYRHQVLGQSRMSPWGLFLAVKWLELAHHARPSRVRRLLTHQDRTVRRQFRWTSIHIGAVWLGELVEFVCRTRFARLPRALREFSPEVPASRSPRVELTVRARRMTAPPPPPRAGAGPTPPPPPAARWSLRTPPGATRGSSG